MARARSITAAVAAHPPQTPLIAPPAHAADGPAYAFLQKLAQELAQSPINLPCFPDIVPRIRQALADPNSTAEDIERIAATEPRLTARLLQTANSAVFNPSGISSSNLRHAVTRLGHELVQSVTMAFALQQIKAEPALRSVAKQLDALWEKSLAAASICKLLAKRLRVPADKVFLTGLLHGIGYFYIMVRAAQSRGEIGVDQLLTDFVAERHPAIGRAVMEKWRFETVMCEAVGNQNDHARRTGRAADITDVVIAAVLLADALIERGGDLRRCDGVPAFATLDLTTAELEAILRHTENTIASVRDALGR